MYTVIQKLGKKVRVQCTVEEEPSPGTLGNLLLLKEQYRFDGSKFEQMLFNTSFLLWMKKRYGKLHCVYCGRRNLKIYNWREYVGYRKNMATADHFLPKSEFPELARERKNLRVCCRQCNERKANKIWEEKFPYPKITNNE